MRFAGQITEWNDERGFGFVVPNGGGDRAFVHISEVKPKTPRPIVGDFVTYATGRDSRGRLRATAVTFARDGRPRRHERSRIPRTAMGIFALATVVVAFAAGLLPAEIAGAYLVLSFLSFLMYGNDKRAARADAWRTPEHTLHMFDLLGGWPGALIAQQTFHHKTIKQPFQLFFWVSVIANIAGISWLIGSGMATQLTASFFR